VANIRHDPPRTYVADMLIDGEQKSFLFEARGESSFSMEPAFEDIFAFAEGTGKIAVLIGEYRRGKQIQFPVDLGEIVDFRPTFALGGPKPEDEGPAGGES